MVESLMQTGNSILPSAIFDIGAKADSLYYFIIALSILFFIPLCSIILYFLIKYRRTPSNVRAKRHITEHHVLELVWTVVPLILVGIIFYWGFLDYLKLSVAPQDAYEIRVSGKKWMWVFEYPKTGKKSPSELVVPIDTPIKLVMNSEDVIHSFFAPNLRIKRDVLPNRYTTVWFNANRAGNFQIFCTEYCGDGHSKMLGNIRVVSQKEFERWLKAENEAEKTMPLSVLGENAYKAMACNTCHSLDGSKMAGPTWKGIYGAKHKMVDGSEIVVDDTYIRDSILNPKAKVVAGYAPVMPAFQGLLSERQIAGIIELIKNSK